MESRPELLQITTAEDEKTQRWWMEQRLRSAEAADWGRKTEGAEKRFATAGSISWKTLERGCGLSAVEIAKRKTPEEHLHKFLTHHEIERLRFDLRAKLCDGSTVERPRKGPWCNKHSRVSPHYEAGAVVEHERYRNDGLRLSQACQTLMSLSQRSKLTITTLIVIDLRQFAATSRSDVGKDHTAAPSLSVGGGHEARHTNNRQARHSTRSIGGHGGLERVHSGEN